MTPLLVVLSVLVAALLLSVLALGLLLIMKTLQSVRGSLEQIAMGVRAIETQAGGIGPGVAAVTGELRPLAETLASAAERLGRLSPELEAHLNRIRR
jgi:uncharacterized protein YoxC